jgi:hypothetical protein
MEDKVKESDLDSNIVGRGFSNPVHTIGLEDGTVVHTDENGVAVETNELNPDELMSGLDNPQIANIMEQFLPEDMKNLSPEEIEERINKTLAEANAPKDVSITNKDILRDEYDTIKELLANKYFGLCSDVTLENHRVKFLESVSDICNTVKEFEENVIERENSEVIEERLGKVFKLSLKHFLTTCIATAQGDVEALDKELQVEHLLHELFVDSISIYQLLIKTGELLGEQEAPENRFLDFIVTRSSDIHSIMVSTIISLDKLIDFEINRLLEDGVEALQTDRNKAFVNMLNKYL